MDINNFVVRITEETKPIVKKWWEKEFPGDRRIWDVGSGYGKRGGEAFARGVGYASEVPEISFQEFEQNILNNDYQIY